MPNVGMRSTTNLNSAHLDLQTVFREVVKLFDCSIIQGHRSVDEQWELFKKGRKLKHPGLDPEQTDSWEVQDRGEVVAHIDGKKKKGMHNYEPSKAIDAAPYPIDWRSKEKVRARFYLMAGVVLAISEALLETGKITHKIRWGGDWDFDQAFEDQTFDDLPHYELYKPKI